MVIKRVARAVGLAGLLALGGGQAQAESIKEALANAYSNNPEIISALLGAKIQAEQVVQAKAGKLPTVSAGGSVNKTWDLINDVSSDSSALSLNYSQTLFDNFATEAQIEAAKAGALAQAEATASTEQDILLNAASAYVNVVRDTELVQLQADNVTFLQAQVKSAQDRLEIGEGTRIAVSQAEASAAQAVANYQSAINDLRASQATYERYIGHAPQNLTLSFPYEHLLPGSLEQARQLADEEHPAIKAALASIRAAQASADAAEAAFGPTVGLSGSLSSGNHLLGSTGTESLGASIGLSLSVPLYSGGALNSQARAANLSRIQSEIDAYTVRDQIRVAVISAWSSLQTAAATISAVESAEKASKLYLDGVIEELNVGQATTLDVLDARSDLTDVQVSKITAQTGRITAAFSLLSSIGKLSAEYLDLPVQVRASDGYQASVGDIWGELRDLSE